MNFLLGAIEYLLGGPKVGGADEERLRRWLALPEPPLALPHAQARYVAVATEMTGRDVKRDRLAALGAVAVDRMEISLAGCFTVVLRQGRARAEGGLDGLASPPGDEPKAAILDFLEFLGKSPLVAFRVELDRRIIERGVKSILGVPFRHRWIDLAVPLPTLFPEAESTTREAWLARFGIPPGAAGNALATAYANAQLLQIVLDAASRTGRVNARQLIDIPRA